jgi:ribosomal protein L22
MGRATPIRKRMSHLTVLVATPAADKALAIEEATPETAEAKPAQKTRAKKTTPAKSAAPKTARKSAAKTKTIGKKKAK